MSKQIQSWCTAVLFVFAYWAHPLVLAAQTSGGQNANKQAPVTTPKASQKTKPVKLEHLKPLSEKDIQKANQRVLKDQAKAIKKANKKAAKANKALKKANAKAFREAQKQAKAQSAKKN